MKHGSNLFSTHEVLDALLVFGACGALSVLLDYDHVPVLIAKGLPITAENLITQAARPLHYPLLILLGIVCLYTLSRLARLRSKAV